MLQHVVVEESSKSGESLVAIGPFRSAHNQTAETVDRNPLAIRKKEMIQILDLILILIP